MKPVPKTPKKTPVEQTEQSIQTEQTVQTEQSIQTEQIGSMKISTREFAEIHGFDQVDVNGFFKVLLQIQDQVKFVHLRQAAGAGRPTKLYNVPQQITIDMWTVEKMNALKAKKAQENAKKAQAAYEQAAINAENALKAAAQFAKEAQLA